MNQLLAGTSVDPIDSIYVKIIYDNVQSISSSQFQLREQICYSYLTRRAVPCTCKGHYPGQSCRCTPRPYYEHEIKVVCWDPNDVYLGGGSGDNWNLLDFEITGPISGGNIIGDIDREKKVFFRNSGKDIDAMCDLLVSGILRQAGVENVSGAGLVAHVGAEDCCDPPTNSKNCLKGKMLDYLDLNLDEEIENCLNIDVITEIVKIKEEGELHDACNGKTNDEILEDLLTPCPASAEEVRNRLEDEGYFSEVIYNDMKDCYTDAEICEIMQSKPDWLTASSQEKIDVIINKMRYLQYQKKCGGTVNIFSIARMFSNAPGWDQDATYSGEACSSTSNSDIDISYQGGTSCNDCINITPCNGVETLPSGRYRITFVSCSGNCGTTTSCLSFYFDTLNEATDFENAFIRLTHIQC